MIVVMQRFFPEGWSDERIVREFSEGLKSESTALGPFGRETVKPSSVEIKYFVMNEKSLHFTKNTEGR